MAVFHIFAAALAFTPAAPHPPAPAPIAYGTISVCAAVGSRPVTGTLAFTLAAPASAGGTQTVNVAVGNCTTPAFYPAGTALNVIENVPTGDAVTTIALAGAGSLGASSPTAGSATVAIAVGATTLTFTTNGPVTAVVAPDCKVPNVLGLGLAAAKAIILRHGCRVGLVHRRYSTAFRLGHVLSESPRRGTVLAHGALVDLGVSRGPRA